MTQTSFWQGRRVFLTGHTGFKGSWLALWLQRLGAQVTGYALEAPTQPSLFEEARVADGLEHILGDVRDAGAVRAAMERAQPEVVFHLAAQSLVRHSYAEPVETYATNVMGTVHVLDAARRIGSVRAVVNVTTDKCYENLETERAYRESDVLGGRDPYSNSKACSELVTQAYRQSFFAPGATSRPNGVHSTGIATARAGNVIGGGDWAVDRLVPDLLRAFDQGVPAIVRRPHAVRPWQHVLEPLAGYLTLAERLYAQPQQYSGAWNFGPRPDDMRPVDAIAAALTSALGEHAAYVVQAEAGAPHEAGLLLLDAAKARGELDWDSALELEEALRWIAEWHQARRAGHNVREITLEQIGRYEARLGRTAAHAAASAVE
ncbi:CDP-glucose 4,6-dehydratase [Paraburkholderia phenazinium]|uniref:CDP-glucose 4,6-dehydratase n=1 Tax=Paraburkholderia phenazinium TaxID=60549 RepID=A0A1G7PWA5_9BURK|nr:CDP-glucose 4,6-dehydratase [Paraburkholderia phenazinium]SDF90544.1 CDP-glucose 4,6-dehydratase [Paraburkholderia phenazinium]